MVPDPVSTDSCKANLDFFSFGLLRLRRSFRGKVCGAYFGEFSTARENVKSATGRGHPRHHRGCHSCQGGSSGDDDDLELGADSPDSGRFLRGKIEPDEAAAAAGVVHFPSLSKFTHANFHGQVCERVFRRPSKQSVKAASSQAAPALIAPQKRAHV